MVSASNLRIIAMCGGVSAIVGALYIQEKLQGNFRNTQYFRQSMKLLHQYPVATEMFGQPIRPKKLDLGDEDKLKVDGFKAKMVIPVVGPKDSGSLHSWSSREKLGNDWKVDRLDLEVKSSGKKWTFYKREEESDVSNL